MERRLRESVPTPTDSKRRVLLLATSTSYRVLAYREAADYLGIALLVACDGSQALISDVVDGLRVDLSAPDLALERIESEHARWPFCAVVSADDATVELAVVVASRLGLAHNPLVAARRTRRKDLARVCLAEAGLPVPGFKRLDLSLPIAEQLQDVQFPCVVKPLSLSASRGVIRADNSEELAAACTLISKIVTYCSDEQARQFVLVEDYLPGVEVAVEGLLRNGVLDVLAYFDKPDPLIGPYFEETYYITPSSHAPDALAVMRNQVQAACSAYGLVEGPVHAELRWHKGEAWILEIASRTIGGDCARLLKFGTGVSLEALVLGCAAGLSLDTTRAQGAAGVLMLPTQRAGILRRVEGVLEASRVPYVDELVIAVREGYELVPLPEGSSYLGFVFATAPDPQTVERSLREAFDCLNVVVAPVLHKEPAPLVTS